MSEEQRIQGECEAAFELLMRRYADRLDPEMADCLRAATDTVVRTVTALRSVQLENGDAPLIGFAPLRKEG